MTYNFIIIIDKMRLSAYVALVILLLLVKFKLGNENELKEPKDEKPKIKVKHVTLF